MSDNTQAVSEKVSLVEITQRLEAIAATGIFENTVSPFKTEGPFIYAVEQLTPELRAVLIQSISQQ